ncbi:MAG: hypothetical protein AAF639_10310 [Chloroflexota bacterium]
MRNVNYWIVAIVVTFVVTLYPTPSYAQAIDSQTDSQINSQDIQTVQESADTEHVRWIEVAAESIGVTVRDLRTARRDGQSIADVAVENNVDVQTVIDAIVAAEQTATDQAVTDGEITQAEADEWMAEVPELASEYVNDVPRSHWGDLDIDISWGDWEPSWDDSSSVWDNLWDNASEIIDNHTSSQTITNTISYTISFTSPYTDAHWVDWHEVAAETISVTVESLWEAQKDGQSIAEVATANGVLTQTVVDAIVSAQSDAIDQWVADDLLTEEKAEKWKAELPARVSDYVAFSWEDKVDSWWNKVEDWWDGWWDSDKDESDNDVSEDWLENVDWFWIKVVAETLNVERNAVWDAVKGCQSLADFAVTQGSTGQALIDAIVESETEMVNEALSQGFIEQEKADEWLAEVESSATDFVNLAYCSNDDSENDDGIAPIPTASKRPFDASDVANDSLAIESTPAVDDPIDGGSVEVSEYWLYLPIVTQ